MMKYFTFIPAVLLSLTSVNALAVGYICKTITGTIQQLSPDQRCNILQEKPNRFPDVTFYVELGAQPAETCFSGELADALFGNTPVTGTSYHGLTVNGIGKLTAASAIRLTAAGHELGKVYTQDATFNPGTAKDHANTKELLTMVSGSKRFKDGHGHVEITGNALYGETQFSGMLCIKR